MRAGGSTVQQALTSDAASIVKQAVSLARRRGHAQVTPLHVANVMLCSSTGLLRAACLQSQSQSHPLQCKALELCFNVALNRLPASTSSVPMLTPHPTTHGHHHHHPPSLSNALVAAFKRAQAQQRRGSIESQQQPLLAVKIEVEQLIISILDDPSVSRVMREAGFSSTQVKCNLEQAVSLEISNSSSPSTTAAEPKESPNTGLPTAPGPVSRPKLPPAPDQVRQEDVTTVVDFLVGRKKSSVVVVGECLATTEGVVRAVMDNVGKAEVPEVLRNIQFISLPLMTFRCLSREDVEQKVGELRCLVKTCCVERGVILYLGDLKWAAEYRAAAAGKGRGCYCPVEHVTIELGRLVSGGFGEEADGGRFWLVGVATYQTYMKCRAGRPSLEAIWGLHPLTIPAGNLGLTLSCSDSGVCGDVSSWPLIGDGGENKLSCCRDCSAKFEIEARGLVNSASSDHGSATSSQLPPWLQQYKEENRITTSSGQDQLQIRDLCKKWNSICSSSHNVREKILSFSSVSPTSSSNISSYDQQCNNLLQPRQAWPVPINSKNTWRDHHNWISQATEEGYKPTSGSHMQGSMRLGSSFDDHPNPNPNPNPNPISTFSISETMEVDYRHGFKQLNAENLKTLCLGLEKKVAWQKNIIPEIAGTVLRCRSGMVRRKDTSSNSRVKEDTWLFFQGGDNEGKEKMARGLACLVFGSQADDHFTSIGLSSFSSTRSGSSDDLRNKRSRSEASHSYIARFAEAVRSNPHSVFLMEDVEQMDYYSQMGIKNAIERGRIRGSDGEEVGLGDAIVILSCESFDSRSRACSPSIKHKSCESEEQNGVECEEEATTNGHSCVALDLNLCAGDDDDLEDWLCFDDVHLLELVDGRFFFKLKED